MKNDKKIKLTDSLGNGEFVATFDKWVDLDEQKQITQKLENLTKKE